MGALNAGGLMDRDLIVALVVWGVLGIVALSAGYYGWGP